jgi:hypothetical protein
MSHRYSPNHPEDPQIPQEQESEIIRRLDRIERTQQDLVRLLGEFLMLNFDAANAALTKLQTAKDNLITVTQTLATEVANKATGTTDTANQAKLDTITSTMLTVAQNLNDAATVVPPVGGPSLKPVVSAFSPASASVGNVVIISGSNFSGVTAVTFFNNIPATTFSVDPTGTSITATVPVGATTGSVSVTTPAGTGASFNSLVVA